MKESRRKSLTEELKLYDTVLLKSVEEWLDALERKQLGIPFGDLVSVCRYANWIETIRTFREGPVKNEKDITK